MDLIRGRLASQGQARDRHAALHRAPDRQGHLGPALLREDAPGRARAARGVPAPHRPPRLPGRRGGRRRPRCASNRTWSPIAATASAARRGTTDQGQHAVTYVEPLCVSLRTSAHARAACGSRPGEPTRSASTSPSAATRWSARRSTSATCCRAGRSHCPRRASCCTPALLGFPHPVTGAPHRLQRRAARRLPRRARIARGVPWRLPDLDRHPLGARRGHRGDPLGLRPDTPSARRSCPTPATIPRSSSGRRRCWSSSGRATSGCGCSASRTSRTTGAGAAGRQPLGRHPVRRRDACCTGIHRDHPAPPARAPAGGQLRLSLGLDGQRRRARRRRPGVDARRLCRCWRAGELVAVFPEGLKRRRQALPRAVPAGALRPGRLRPPGARGPGAAAAGRHRRRRGDPPGHRQDHPPGRAARPPVHPDNADVSVAWARWACCRSRPSGRSRSAPRSRRRRPVTRPGRRASRRRFAATIDGMIADLLAQRQIDSLRLKYVGSSLTLYSCGTIQFSYKVEPTLATLLR